MNITVYGAGYVGLVTAVCLAKFGHHVVCVDIDPAKVKQLSSGEPTIYEAGLAEILQEVLAESRIVFTTDIAAAVTHGDVQFIAVGTPPQENGEADLRYVKSVIASINTHLTRPCVIVNKSTVPVGTADLVQKSISIPVSVVSNPEFLREGCAISDFMHPERIIIGTSDQKAVEIMREVYAPLIANDVPFLVMQARSAELTKYACNAFLASKISFINEMSHIAERYGADIEDIKVGMAHDSRIANKFLNAGCGYGGSCFPKDVLALIALAKDVDYEPQLLQATEEVNQRQQRVLFRKLNQYFSGDLQGKTIAIWGLAFKPGTDDIRSATSLVLISDLLAARANIQAYDPLAMSNVESILGGSQHLKLCNDALEALIGADALVLVTEWDEFITFSPEIIKNKMKGTLVLDGRNALSTKALTDLGLIYLCIGKGENLNSLKPESSVNTLEHCT